MMDVLRHVEPCFVQVSEARGRDRTVAGEHEVLVESISDVAEGRAPEVTRRGKAVEIARGRGHTEGDACHRVLQDDHAEVMRIRRRAPVVIGMVVVSAHGETHRALRVHVRREADPEPTRGECSRRERVGTMARGQEDACRDERARTELTHASVRMDNEDRAHVRVGRVDVSPGDGGSRRPERHQPKYRENPTDLEHAPTHEPHPHHHDPRSGWSENTISFGRGRRSWETSLERPVVSFPQQVAAEVGRLPAVDLHEERPQMLAHEPTGRPVRLEVDAVVLDPFLLSINSHRVLLDAPREERVRLLIDGDQRRVDRLRGRQAVRPQEDLQEFLEGHLVDVLVHRHIRLDRARLVLDLAAFDLDRDAEPLERLVDLLVDVRLLFRRVLRAVPRFVEVPSRGARPATPEAASAHGTGGGIPAFEFSAADPITMVAKTWAAMRSAAKAPAQMTARMTARRSILRETAERDQPASNIRYHPNAMGTAPTTSPAASPMAALGGVPETARNVTTMRTGSTKTYATTMET